MTAGALVRASVRCATLGARVLAASTASLALAQAVTELHDAGSRTEDHLATQTFRYAVVAPDDGLYLARIEQRGLDVIVSVETPAGAAASHNSPLYRDGEEAVVFGGAPGRYLIEVRSTEYTGARGRHTISLRQFADGADPRELDAWRAVSDASAANFAGGERGWASALAGYERAANEFQALGSTREEADAWFSAATLRYWQFYQWNESAAQAAKAAALYRSIDDDALEANAIHLEGSALIEQAVEKKQSSTATEISAESEELFAEAFAKLERARAIQERLGNVHDLAMIENNLGFGHHSKGDLDLARPFYEQAAVRMRSVDEWAGESKALRNLAVVDGEQGQLLSTIATLERALELLPPELAYDRTLALDNLGAAQRMLGNFEEALQTFATALALQKELSDAQGEGLTLRRIGETYYNLGELELAKQYLERALPVAERTNDPRGQEGALRNLGNVAFVEREYQTALDYHRRALEVSASVWDRAHLQLLIAKDLLALGRATDADAAASQAMSVARQTGSEVLLGSALSASGRAQALAGDPAAARPGLERAAAIFQRLGLRTEHAEALHALALAARAAGDVDRAVEYGEASLRELEALRARVADPELRALFAATRRDYYETQIDLLMTRDARAALHVNERSRARMVADLLQEAAVDLRRGSPELQKKETALYEQLAERRNQRDLLLGAAAQGRRNDEQLEAVVAELAELENELNLLEIELRRSNPRFATLTAPRTLAPAEMQASLDDDTVLLQYSLGTRASYVWVVTRDEIRAAELADRTTIEAAARRALEGLATYAPMGAAADAAALTELAALVLDPIAPRLDRKRIVLALDGPLQYVPFGVLPVTGADGARSRLLESHEVGEVPSMSALALSDRPEMRRASKTLAVFADPVLQASDPRLGASSGEREAVSAVAATRGAREIPGLELGRLLSTSYEAEAIAALLPQEQRLLASGFAATRAAVLEPELGDFRYIHFATHGLVDARYPGLSALVLSQFDDRGNPQDGFLRLTDIYNLKLSADLVVLSACETALGREIRGEGLIGLTQGFMAAGARSLVASLWQVPDRATAELMTQFYKFMLGDGLSPAEALRKAQLWSASQTRYRDPYFWGGFVLVGEFR